MRQQSCLARFFASAAMTAVLAAGLGGCQTAGMPDITGSVGARAEAAPDNNPRRAADVYGERYRGNPKDADAALRYGQALRVTGQRSQAVAVLEQATIAHPGNKALLAGFGRALADNGNFQQGVEGLGRAHSPGNPDWRDPFGLGGGPPPPNTPVGGFWRGRAPPPHHPGRHDEARRYYATALKIVPEEPSVLSNVGMSYVLSKDLPKAEENLRRAYGSAGADARVRQNLGLVVGLQGRFAEAETIVKADLPPEEAAANVAYLKQMLSRKDNPRSGPTAVPVAALNRRD